MLPAPVRGAVGTPRGQLPSQDDGWWTDETPKTVRSVPHQWLSRSAVGSSGLLCGASPLGPDVWKPLLWTCIKLSTAEHLSVQCGEWRDAHRLHLSVYLRFSVLVQPTGLSAISKLFKLGNKTEGIHVHA